MRNESIRKIINVDQPNHLPIWSFKQEDDGVLRLSLFKGSTLLDITGQTIKLGAKRPNNSIIELTDGFEINSNELDIILKNNILAIPGIVECDLEITDVVGKMTTASFYLTVTKKMTGEDNLDASNDISAINKIVAEVLAKGKELDSNIKVVVEEANKKITAIDTALNKKLNEMQEDYNSLQRIIIDENQAANLQNQVNQTNAQLEHIVLDITNYKTNTNDWNEAFENAYNSLPQYGGDILIPVDIIINRPIDLTKLGRKYVNIVGKYKCHSMSAKSTILKNGDFDGVILSNGCSLKNISLSKNENIVDNSDGIVIKGLGCLLENVSSSNNGGDGIRIGSKVNENINCNISKLINVACYGNSGYGIHYNDENSPQLPNANASTIFGADCRDNGKGGICYKNCIDNNAYGVDCEENGGEYGIYIGENAKGINVYSPYLENPRCVADLYLHEKSEQCIIFGCRSNTLQDRYVNNGKNNFVLGRNGAKSSLPFLRTAISINGLGITNDKLDDFGMLVAEQRSKGIFDFKINGIDEDSLIYFKNSIEGRKVTLVTDTLKTEKIGVLGQDNITKTICKSGVTNAQTIPANTTIHLDLYCSYAEIGDVVNITPQTGIPGFMIWCGQVDRQNNVKLRISNPTTNPIEVNETTWNIILFKGESVV